MYESDVWLIGKRCGLHMLGEEGNYRLQNESGLTLVNKLKTLNDVLAYVRKFSNALDKSKKRMLV